MFKNVFKSKVFENKKVFYNFNIEKSIVSGIQLQGWEVKSIRIGSIQIQDSYVILKNEEAFLIGSYFCPLKTSCNYIKYDPYRSRKLLLNKKEILNILVLSQRKGYSIVLLSLFWKNSWCKAKIGIARGKKNIDKRLLKKKKEWDLEKNRLFKRNLNI